MAPATLSRKLDPSDAGPALDEALSFMRLLWAIDHELERVSKRMEATIGLTIPQRLCLLLIGTNPGILASQIADILHLHRGTLSGILQRLEAAGLITRTPEATDARRMGLALTRDGWRLKGQRAGTFERAVRRMLAHVSDADRRAAERVLVTLRRELQAIT